MLCPECGEIIGPGPLDVRRAQKEDGYADKAERRLFERFKTFLYRIGERAGGTPTSEQSSERNVSHGAL